MVNNHWLVVWISGWISLCKKSSHGNNQISMNLPDGILVGALERDFYDFHFRWMDNPPTIDELHHFSRCFFFNHQPVIWLGICAEKTPTSSFILHHPIWSGYLSERHHPSQNRYPIWSRRVGPRPNWRMTVCLLLLLDVFSVSCVKFDQWKFAYLLWDNI